MKLMHASVTKIMMPGAMAIQGAIGMTNRALVNMLRVDMALTDGFPTDRALANAQLS